MTILATIDPGVARAEQAHNGTWNVERVLAGEPVTSLGAGPPESEVVWAGTAAGKVWRSDDAGRNWRLRSPEHGIGMSGIRAIGVAPHDPDIVYVGTKPAGVWWTHDGGASWAESPGFARARRWFWFSPAEPPSVQPYVSAICVSPDDPDVILAGIEAGAVLRSEDGGRTWSDHRLRADRDCHALTFHATDGLWAYEAGGGGPAFSRDGGRTWRHAAAGLEGRYSMACAADPERPEVWYVSASPLIGWPRFWQMPVAHVDGHAHASLYRSSGGADWERLTGGLPQPLDHMAYGLATDPGRPGRIYAGLANGEVWWSEDHGDSWSRLPVDLGGVRRAFLVA